jgi:hypothetical protein
MSLVDKILSDIYKKNHQKNSFNLSRIKKAVFNEENPLNVPPKPVVQEEVVQEDVVPQVPEAPQVTEVTEVPEVVEVPEKKPEEVELRIDGGDLMDLFIREYEKENPGRGISNNLGTAITNKLGPPDNKKADHRLYFFNQKANRHYLPDDIKKMVEMAEASGKALTNPQFAKLIFQADNNEGYYGGNFQELMDKLREVVVSDFNAVNLWVLKGLASVTRTEKKEKGDYGYGINRPVSLNQQIGEGSEIGTNVADRDDVLSDKALQNATPQEVRYANEISRFYAQGYLNNVLDKTKDLSNEGFKAMTGDASKIRGQARDIQEQIQQVKDLGGKPSGIQIKKQKDLDKKAQKLQTKAERMAVYMNVSSKYLGELFAEGAIKDGSIDAFNSGGDLVFRKRAKDKRGQESSFKIPREEGMALLDYIQKASAKMGIKSNEIPPKSKAMQDIINSFIKERGDKWESNWRRLVGEKALIENYKDIGRFKKSIKNYEKYNKGHDPQTILSVIPGLNAKLTRLFPDPADRITFIEGTVAEDDKIINQWLKSGDGKEEGGGAPPKNQMRTDVIPQLPYLMELKNRDKDKYSTPVFRSYLDLMVPHNDIIKGGKNARTRVEKGDMGPSEIYHTLVDSAPSDFSKFRQKIKNLKNKKRDTNNDTSMLPDQRREEKEKLQSLIDNYGKFLPEMEEYSKSKLEIEKIEKKKRKAENKLKMLQNKGTKTYKEKEGLFREPKSWIDQKKIINECKKDISTLEHIIGFMEKGTDFPALLANSRVFKMVYAALQETNKRVVELNDIKNKYKNMKVAFSLDSMDNSIYEVLKSFENRYGFIFD